MLEPLPDGGFRARSGDPLELTAQGDSPDSALRQLRDLIETRVASGALLTTIEVLDFRAGRHPAPGFIEKSRSSISGEQPSMLIARRSTRTRRYRESLCPDDTFSNLAYEALKRMKLNVRKMDLRIAATVLEHGGVLATRNVRDFQRVPGLLIEDWVS